MEVKLAKYKKGVVLDVHIQWICNEIQAGAVQIECPKCKYHSNIEYCYTKHSAIEPKYCPYCGEYLIEESEEDEDNK